RLHHVALRPRRRHRQAHAGLRRAGARSPRPQGRGLDVEMIYGDDQRKPDVGKQLADEMLKKHKVHFVSGIIWSNVMLAVAPVVTGAGTFMIGTNAGPHELAGKGCHELFFTTSWQNDQTPE